MVATVAMIAAVSCNKEFSNDNLFRGDVITFRASVDGADTKAVLDGKKSSWEADDKITIINAEKGFEFSASEAGPAVNFCYNNENKDFSGDKFYAVYPAGNNYSADFEKNTVNAYIPTYQRGVANSYSAYRLDDNAPEQDGTLAIAYTEDKELKFKNAAALIKFSVANNNITNVKFYGNNKEAITGNMKVTLDANHDVVNVEGQTTHFTWDNGESDELGTWVEMYAWAGDDHKFFEVGDDENPKFYYIAVAPVKFTKGFAVKVIIDGIEHEIKKYTAEGGYELKPNTILNIGELKYEEPVAEEFVPQDGFVYLQPNVYWKSDNARFAAYFFGNGETWEHMTLVEGQTNIYGCQVPDGYVDVIFCRMNPSVESNGWDGKWNQTSDLKMTDGRLYTIEEGAWDKGTWSGDPAVVEPTPEPEPEPEPEPAQKLVYLKPNSNWTQANARFAIYIWGGTPGEKWVSMTAVGDGTYQAELPEGYDYGCNIIFCRMNPSATANNWNNKWNQTGNLTVPKDGTNLYTVKAGTWDNGGGTWSTK